MVAPMMGWTTRHWRYLMHLFAPNVLLYTEMCAAQAIVHTVRRDRLLDFHPSEKPLALQLGGSDTQVLMRSVQYAQSYGYHEINLNVGCPSARVQKGCFGAALFKDPYLVAECVYAMAQVSSIPITVKTRVGVDTDDRYEDLSRFIQIVSEAGCRTFIIHARKACLGLNPKANRTIPPLNYPFVYQIKRDFPHLTIVLNGGLNDLEVIESQLNQVDGVMIGRAAWHHPYLMAQLIARRENIETPKRSVVVQRYLDYVQEQQNETLGSLLAPLFGLFYGHHGAQAWRRLLSDSMRTVCGNFPAILDRAKTLE